MPISIAGANGGGEQHSRRLRKRFRHPNLRIIRRLRRKPFCAFGLQAAISIRFVCKKIRRSTPQAGPSDVHHESLAIPSFSISSYIVGRLMPSSRAAEVIFPR